MASSERERVKKKLIIIMITYNALMTSWVKKPRGKKRPKAMQKQLRSCFRISKKQSLFFLATRELRRKK